MKTIYDLDSLKKLPFLVQSVGRLDFNTEGLLIVTNDGDLANKLAHPRHGVAKLYQAVVSARLTTDQEKMLQTTGLVLDDGPIKPLEFQYSHAQPVKQGKGYCYFVTVDQGRNRLVRRIFEHFDLSVYRLFRYGYGELRIDESVARGAYRQLTSDEIASLRATIHGDG